MDLDIAKFVPWLPFLASGLCGLCCIKPAFRKLAGPICVISIFLGLLITIGVYTQVPKDGGFAVVNFFTWIQVGQLSADFGYFFDPLTLIMMFVITGMGTLITTYAMGYMTHDQGYARFFAFVSLFIFSMLSLVMADNLIVLYLGWEGVGLCSYLLIGYYYKYPVAVAAAKKAFIVNRIGDFGFALGIFLTYVTFGSVEYDAILPAAEALLTGHPENLTGTALAAYEQATNAWHQNVYWIPFLLMLGAFGKSAQIPLYVWLPDAMAGPTPVSALIHAATMVTAGVFMVARLTPVFQLSPYALPTVAIIGGITCMFAATIAMTSCDLKGVFAYSTVSQLGYMFIGVGAISVGGVFHLFTHAFFKALLFLTAGSVMHALAGSLDIRHMSGLGKKMPATKWLMFCGCLSLAGFPLTSGFFSKDLALGDAVIKGLDHADPFATWYMVAGVLGIITAGMTAFYSFRLWFKVFTGPEEYAYAGEGYEPDNDLEKAMIAVAKEEHEHMAEQGHGHGDHGDDHHHAPHEMPWWPMNAPLIVLALGALAFGFFFKPWIKDMLDHSTQFAGVNALEALHGSHDPEHLKHVEHAKHMTHLTVEAISGTLAVVGIVIAGVLFWLKRDLVATLRKPIAPLVNLLYHKYYVDEFYDLTVVKPLRAIAHLCYLFDSLVIDGLVLLFGWLPRLVGYSIKPTQSGRLQGYGVGMAFGLGAIVLLIFYVTTTNPQ